MSIINCLFWDFWVIDVIGKEEIVGSKSFFIEDFCLVLKVNINFFFFFKLVEYFYIGNWKCDLFFD